MLIKKVEQALNSQIQKEIASAYLYLAMSAHLENKDLPGMANWMKVQAHEEMGHAMRLFGYVVSRDGCVVLEAIEKPDSEFGSALEVFDRVLKHEQYVTESISKLYELAVSEKDYPTQSHLQWFIDEQVEEEKTAKDVLTQLKVAEGHPPILLMLDQQLGKRPAASAAAE